MESRGDRLNAPNLLILITDGAATVDKHLTLFEAGMVKQSGIITFAIGIGNEVGELGRGYRKYFSLQTSLKSPI